VGEAISLVCAVLGTVTSCVTAYIAWQQEKRYTQTLERVGNSSDPAFLADVERRRKMRRRLKRRRRMWWGLTGITAAVAVGGFLGWRMNHPGPSEWRIQILATQDWTDTRVDCRSGSVLEIATTGTIYHKPGGRGFSPDGNPDPKARGANVKGLRDVNHAALIGSIDGQPPYFPVGKKKTYICDAVGRLFLGINDKGVDNNRGKFVARTNEDDRRVEHGMRVSNSSGC
jgi:hypothetical protein